jgi:hypothetical protein
VNSHIVSHTPRPDDRAFECSCHHGLLHNTIRSQQCGADAAEKELPDPQHPVVAVPPRRKRARAELNEVLLWGASCSLRTAISWPVSLDTPCRLPRGREAQQGQSAAC